NLHLDLYLDSFTNSAFFKLYSYIFLKKFDKDNKQAIYLFIYPENIQTITWETASYFSRTRTVYYIKLTSRILPQQCILNV
ncbi:hypothetical protein BKA56DRAFT_709094, partial [Ilyonectria sp. MPI-CAGE-AT-0026]